MAMSGNTAKARQFMEDGEKCLTKWSIFGNTTKHEDAAENFEKAGRLFKVAKAGDEAASAYEKAAEHYLISKSNHEAGRSFVEAARCRKGSPEAVTAFLKAIDIFEETGRFQQAGKMYTEIGDIYQADGNFEEAVEALHKGADLLVNEGASAQANACLVKIAGMLSKDMKPPKLGEAAKIYEQLGQSCTEKKLLQMNAKSYWLQAGLCLLALGDTVGARNKMVDFCDADHNFEGSREYRFFENLIKTLEELDVEAFSQYCFEYDEISKLDPWKTSMLLKIKRTIQAQEDESEDIDLR